MLKVKITYHINTGVGISTQDVWLERYVEMPFPPVKGLYIYDEKDWEDEIKEVYYNTKKQTYEAWVPSDEELYQRALHDREALTEQEKEKIMIRKVKEALETGWKIQCAPDYIKEAIKGE